MPIPVPGDTTDLDPVEGLTVEAVHDEGKVLFAVRGQGAGSEIVLIVEPDQLEGLTTAASEVLQVLQDLHPRTLRRSEIEAARGALAGAVAAESVDPVIPSEGAALGPGIEESPRCKERSLERPPRDDTLLCRSPTFAGKRARQVNVAHFFFSYEAGGERIAMLAVELAEEPVPDASLLVRFWLSREQVASLVLQIERLLGMPPTRCPICGQPMGVNDHQCVREN